MCVYIEMTVKISIRSDIGKVTQRVQRSQLIHNFITTKLVDNDGGADH